MTSAPTATGELLPFGLLAELSHRCPLRCPYCSNPVELVRKNEELSTETWKDVFAQAADLGVLQVHLSGGEPTVRPDLEELVAAAAEAGLYTNLITSGVLLSASRLQDLAKAGLDHVQLSLQAASAELADKLGGFDGGHLKKLTVAGWVRDVGLPLTLNAVVHRQNLHQLEEIVELALAAGASRLEVAHAQYLGWALRNRDQLLPSRRQLDRATRFIEETRERLKGVLAIDYVVPDYHGVRPKACMGGWGRQLLVVTPRGDVLPCHGAGELDGLVFDNVKEHRLDEIWQNSPGFNRFRGTHWMPEPCRSCPQKESDWGGCRCQAFALTGDAAKTDPVCALSPDHHLVAAVAEAADEEEPPAELTYRSF